MTKLSRSFAEAIDELRSKAANDPTMNQLLSVLRDIDDSILSEENNPKFRLPYSSEPEYVGERWKTSSN